MNFSKLTLSDIETVRRYSRFNADRACDLSPGCLVMWRKFYGTEFCVENDAYFSLLHGEDGRVYYNLPLCGKERLPEAIAQVYEHCRRKGEQCSFCTVTEQYLPLMREVLCDITVTEHREYSDYLYMADDMISLSGKKYATQRNHISRFQREYADWSFEPINGDNAARVAEFMNGYCEQYAKQEASAAADCAMALEVLENFDIYGMYGGVLSVSGKVVGFSLGETVGDTLIIHTEKADRGYLGAYQMLTNQFARMYGASAQYINREDDMGDEGLRRAKLAYRPVTLIKKHTVCVGE